MDQQNATPVYTADAAGNLVEVKGKTSTEVIKSVMETAIANRTKIDDKKSRASAAVSATLTKLKPLYASGKETEANDKYVEQLIVTVGNTIGEMESLRKAYTGTINAWLKGEIAPENELKLEKGKLAEMRNDRVKRLKAEADKKNAEIEAKRKRDLAETEVKRRMKLSVTEGIAGRVVELDKSIGDNFNKMTLKNAAAIKKQLESLKPGLKEDYFLSLFQVEYFDTDMSPDHFEDLVKRAKTFWVFETLSAEYTASCQEVIRGWLEKYPQRIKELEIIAKGGDQGRRVEKISNERIAAEQAETTKNREVKLEQDKAKINQEALGTAHSVEFSAQVQSQAVTHPTGTRTERYFTIDNPGDTYKLAQIIQNIIIHTVINKNLEDRIKMVVQHDADGKPKYGPDGYPIYTNGVQFWLDMAATLKYNPVQDGGITVRERIKAVNKSK